MPGNSAPRGMHFQRPSVYPPRWHHLLDCLRPTRPSHSSLRLDHPSANEQVAPTARTKVLSSRGSEAASSYLLLRPSRVTYFRVIWLCTRVCPPAFQLFRAFLSRCHHRIRASVCAKFQVAKHA
eukprot:4846978-Pleurochrysis_carterae.AAC.10